MLSAVLMKAIGDRSIRQTAIDADVAASYISGILKGKYMPSAEILSKIAATAQNGVTKEELMIAAGYLDKRKEDVMDNKVTVKTIRELCKGVAGGWTPLLTENETIVIYQDLIGHATVEENKALANDPALMETFYRIYGVAYGTVSSIYLYLDNSNKVYNMREELEDYKEEYKKRKDECEGLKERIINLQEIVKDKDGQIAEIRRDMDGTIQALEMVRKENIELKAKLYDALQKGN